MAELKCKDGAVIKISDETELRKVFGQPPPSYKDGNVRVSIDNNIYYPIEICEVTRDVKDTEAYIVALQEAVIYCKQHDLGVN